MSTDNKPTEPSKPQAPVGTPPNPETPTKPKLDMDIDEVDVSESLERKISA
jgi:hypothetical protein